MTTLLTITTAVLAGCAVALGWRCRKLTEELIARTRYANALFNDLKRIEGDREEYIQLCNIAPDSFGKNFVIIESEHSVSVCKKHGDKYCIIKEFIDPDQDFNRREAEELVEKLNEK